MDLERQALGATARAAGWLCLASSVLPFDRVGGQAVWPWWGLLDAGPWDVAALLLPPLAALGCALLRRLARSKLALSAGLLLGLAAFLSLAWLAGRQVHALPVFGRLAIGLPPLFAGHLGWLLAGLGLLAAGIRLGAPGFLEPLEGRPPPAEPRALARALTAAGLASVLLAYLLPQRGEIPAWDLARGMAGLLLGLGPAGDAGPGAEPVTALLAGHLLSLGPLVLALVASPRLARPGPAFGGALPLLLIAYLPALGLLTGFRALVGDPGLGLVHLRAACLVLALLLVTGFALPALLRALGYEIPWLVGRLQRVDLVLAVALSAPDPVLGLRASLARLTPWGRAFARRRLLLWRAAAEEVPGAAAADLSAVIRCLERRWQEERQAGAPAQGAPEGLPDWPGWMRSPWPAVAFGLGLAGFLLLAWRGGRAQDPGQPWPLGPGRPAVQALLVERLPEVVLDMSRSPLELARLPTRAELGAALQAAEAELPGLGGAVEALLEAGRRGVRRLHTLRRARDRVNQLLQGGAEPYYLSARLRPGDGLFFCMVYRIVESPIYRLRDDGRAFSVLLLERADRLNVVETYMGMAEEAESHVSVVLDRMEVFARERLATAAQRFGPVGEAVRGALEELGQDADAALGRPLDALVLEGLVRHELHHRLAGLEPEPPAALWILLGSYPEDAVRGVTAEVGAYLGELRLSGTYARLRLAWMLDELDESEGREGFHGWARAFLVSHLLGDDMCEEPACRAALARRLVALPGEELLRRVDRMHRALFGQPAPEFEREP